MKTSKKGVELIKKFEGCRLVGYVCPAGVLTIGYGHTQSVDGKPISTKMKITQEKATELLESDLVKYEKKVLLYDKIYHWTQNEFDALVSFCYNIGNINGLTNFGKRTREEIELSILKYNKGAGKVLKGLVIRRETELKMFKGE